jgi:hypothetical protein
MDINSKAKAFWNATVPLLKQVLVEPESDELIKQIDKVVSDFGDYDWEYGPSKKTQFYFCLSPNFREELIDEIDKIISLAPTLNGWEYISCKPRKEELPKWNMLNENDEEITIDARSWKCVVYKFPDQTIDIDIKIEGIKGNLDTQRMAVDIQLTNLLGERNYIKIVKGVNIVSEFSEKDKGRAIPVNELYEVIIKHIPTAQP